MEKRIQFIHKMNLEKSRRPKIPTEIVFTAIVVVIFLIVMLFDLATLNPRLISDLSNLVIALYTAFITVFFTILAIHISTQYGLNSIDVLARKSRGIFVVYSVAILLSVLEIIFSYTGGLLSFQISTQWFTVKTSVPSIVVGMEMAFVVLSVYFFPKYLRETLQISPMEVMRKIGYPNEIGRLCQDGKYSAANEPIGRGLSLIRVCITDLAMRDELEGVISFFGDATKTIPWQEKAEMEVMGKKAKQMLFFSFHNRIEECVFDPLVNAEIKPPVRIMSSFFCNLTKIYIDSKLVGSSLFIEYLDGLSRVTKAYVEAGKREALNNLFFSVLWMFEKNPDRISYHDVTIVLSKGFALSASLIRKIETMPDRKGDLLYIQFVSSTIAERWLIMYPRAFTRIEVDDLVFLMEKGGDVFIGSLIAAMPFVEHEIELIRVEENEFSYKMAVTRFAQILSIAKEILRINRWRVSLKNNSLIITNAENQDILSMSLHDILKEDQLKILESFIERNLLSLT
jgi:hypothetical protein